MWGRMMLDSALPRARAYIESLGRDVALHMEHWSDFVSPWQRYLEQRHLLDGTGPVFPAAYGVNERDAFYTSISARGRGGASGHDAPMIAYDALLGARGSWHELCYRAVFHGGDNDSTGAIASAWYGALYGFARDVPPANRDGLEYRAELARLGRELYAMSRARD